MSEKIWVIGLPVDGSPPDKTRRQQIYEADVLIGGKRHLDQIEDFRGVKIPILSDIDEVLTAIAKARAEGKTIVVLATGDPLWFGIGTTLVRHFGKEAVEIFPTVSSAQVALARLGLSMGDTIVLSRHKKTGKGLEYLRYFPVGVILTSGKDGPSRVIAEILEEIPSTGDWQGYICQCLGMPEERIEEGPLYALVQKDYQTPNVVVVRNPAPLGIPATIAAFGRPDGAFLHEKGLITHPEVRAVVLSKLELDAAKILWDVGAGSGSVGIEAALLNPDIAVHSVEKDPPRVAQIQENCTRFKVNNLMVHTGNIRDILSSLPTPDRIFIGGGGWELKRFLGDLYTALTAGGTMVATTITLESFEILSRFIRIHAPDTEVIQVQVTRQTPFSGYHKMKPDNPITLFKFVKPYNHEGRDNE